MPIRESIRSRGKRRSREDMELLITPLLDVLIIMLVFLLMNYNSSGIVFDIVKGITVPNSQSSSMNTAGVIIQVSPEKILVDNVIVLDLQQNPTQAKPDAQDQDAKILPLYNELVKKRETYQLTAKIANGANPFSGVVNLVVDKSLKYNYLKRIMHTCAMAGYKEYKFVVMGGGGDQH